MSNAIDGLNIGQKKAVTSLGHTLVVACPGSGKTRVLQNKAQYIVQNYPAARVVAVTFTSDSAAELKERIASSCTPEEQDRILTGTFHSLAKFHLEQSGVKVSLMDPAYEHSIVQQALNKSGLDGDTGAVVNLISSIKSKPVAEFLTPEHESLFNEYQSLLKRYRVMDFADLLLNSTKGMLDGSLAPLPTTFMLVDESQDIDELQAEWIQQHVKGGVGVTLVGDDDQSVYSFRNAMGYAGMDGFMRKNKALKITLDTNYRCKEEVLSAAERLILNNKNRLQKSLKAHRGKGGSVSAYTYKTSPDQRHGVAHEIAKDPDGWAVICRTNLLLDSYEAALTAEGVKVKRIGGKSFWDNRTVQEILGILKTLATRDYLGITGFLNRLGCDQFTIDLLMNNNLLFTDDPESQLNNVSSQVAAVKLLVKQFPKWRRQCDNDCLDIALKSIGRFYLDTAFKPSVREQKQHLVDIAIERIKALTGSLSQRLAAIERSKRSTKDDETEYGVVTLVTMHTSKGLEYPKVWLPSSGREICPSKKALDESKNNLEEERRLYYVAMTRAKDKLVISSDEKEGFSRFMDEANIFPIESDFVFDNPEEAAA